MFISGGGLLVAFRDSLLADYDAALQAECAQSAWELILQRH
jgi:hypothetical protein